MTDSIRAEFNTWWDRQPFNAQFEDVKQQMENVWVASREGCVVELPADVSLRQPAEVRDICAQRIKNAGLGVKS